MFTAASSILRPPVAKNREKPSASNTSSNEGIHKPPDEDDVITHTPNAADTTVATTAQFDLPFIICLLKNSLSKNLKKTPSAGGNTAYTRTENFIGGQSCMSA